MMKISHSVFFMVLSGLAGMALASNSYYPQSEIVETTNPKAAQEVMKQAREIQEQDAVNARGNMKKPAQSKKLKKSKSAARKACAQGESLH